MSSEALLHVAQELERLAGDPQGIWKDDVLRLARFARARADDERTSAAPDAPQDPGKAFIPLHKLRKGDVVIKAWPDGTIPPTDVMFQVLRVLHKKKRVSVLTIDGRQLTLAQWDYDHCWPREQARKMPVQWRFRITW